MKLDISILCCLEYLSGRVGEGSAFRDTQQPQT